MSAQRAPVIPTAAQSAVRWWYTLAYDDASPARMAVSAGALGQFSEALAALGKTAPAALIARVMREVTFAEAEQRARASDDETGQSIATAGGERYVWAFQRLSDAMAAARVNRRSDFHAYPQPQTLREASLDRLFQRFPLVEYPRTRVYLFTGMEVCDDPRIGADPCANALVAEIPALVAPEDWGRYTVCGFRQGVSLVRVNATSRWLRVGLRTLEAAWAEATGDLPSSADDARLLAAETDARDALLRIAAAQASRRRNEATGAASEAHAPVGKATTAARRSPQPRGTRLSRQAPRPAV